MKKLILLLLFIPLVSFGQKSNEAKNEIVELIYNPYLIKIQDAFRDDYDDYNLTKTQFKEINILLKNITKVGVKYKNASKSPFINEPKFRVESFSVNSKKNNIDWVFSGSSFSEEEKNKIDNLPFGSYLIKLEKIRELTLDYFEDKKSSFFINLIPYSEIVENGYSPYQYLYGKPIINENDDNDIEIKNSNNSDTVVLLINKETNRVIRNVFINKGTEFTMLDIPDGNYTLKWYSGNYWSSIKMLDNIKGGFQTNASLTKYSEGETIELFGRKIITLTLYSVSDGNVKTEEITLNEFF
ncbi:hypothetical protein OAV51_00485 [Flavobacteriaceae bacterium]|nr:hypothetical protein [Flavobacteriaceae bacterium]